MFKKNRQYMCALIVLLLANTACFPTIHENALPPALLGEPYDYTIDTDSAWNMWGTDELLTALVRGDLPDGITLSSNAEVSGIPTEVGNFEFKVRLYQIDYGYGFFYDDDDVDTDAAWFTLFVTEPSSNSTCPSPDDDALTEFYLCAGTIEVESLAENDIITIDINTFLLHNTSKNYDIKSIQFTVYFDENYFAVPSSSANSTILREAATRQSVTSSFFTATPGQLTLTVAQTDSKENFHTGGRFLDLPLIAIQNVPAGSYPVTVEFGEIITGDDAKATPQYYTVDGSITVTADISEE